MAEGDIEVYGAIRAQTVEGKAAYAAQIYDEAQGKFQSQINQETANDGLVSAKVAQTFTNTEKERARNNIGAPAQATTYNKTQADNLVQELRGFGMSSGAIIYQGGKDPVFYCGRFGVSVHGDDTMKKFNEELDKFHSPVYVETGHTYICEAAEQELQGERYVPVGLCHINLNGSHIWFISNVDGYALDKWTQVFFNAKIGTYTDGGVTKKGILNGQNIVIRTRVKANESDEKYTLWGDFYELPYNLKDLVDTSLQEITQEEFNEIFN